MEKLKKTARGLDTVCKVLFWILIISMALVLIGFIVVLFVDQNVFSVGAANGHIVFSYGGMGIKLSPEEVGTLNMRPFLMITMAIIISVCGIVAYALKVIRSMLNPMKSGEPFDSAVGKGFHKLGWFTIAIGICINVFDLIGKSAITKLLINSLQNVNLPFQIEMQHGFSISFILVAFLFFLLSYVFHYGEELQKLSDETL